MSLWKRCSDLEKKLFFLSHIIMLVSIPFIPVLWDGIFSATNSNASKLYLAGLGLILIDCFFAVTFDLSLYTDWKDRRALRARDK